MTPLKDAAAASARAALDAFLRSGAALDFTPPAAPRVSVLVLVRDRAEVTLACLQSLALGYNRTPLELVVVDNASTDRTAELLARVRGATVVRNAVNAGYAAGVNQAAGRAAGEYLLLLNNDAEVLGRSVDAAVDCLDREPGVAMVGGRVVLLDGTLQEAGCLVWRDGWTHQTARGLAPDDPAAMFERDVDYCSAAFLLVRAGVFRAAGGFDEAFGPAYFEDADFAVRVRKAGWRVAYRPDVVTLHYESATGGAMAELPAVLVRHHALFAGRHADWLAAQPPRDQASVWTGRRADDTAVPVLYLPAAADSVEAIAHIVRALERLDAMVTVGWPGPVAPAGLPRTAEVVPVPAGADLSALLAERPGYYRLALCGATPGPETAAALDRAEMVQAVWDGAGFRPAG